MTRRQFWDRYLRTYDALNMIDEYRAYYDDAARRLCRRPGLVILDAGSGTGNLSLRMRGLGARVVSLDFSSMALVIHKEKDPQAVLVQASLEERLPFEDDAFDAVACTSVFPILSESGVELSLHEFNRVLKPGGSLLVTASRKGLSKLRFAYDQLRARLRSRPFAGLLTEALRAAGPMLRLAYYNVRVYQFRRERAFRRFTEDEFVDRAVAAGFVDIRCRLTLAGRFYMLEAIAPPSSSRDREEHTQTASLAHSGA